jgi:hydroxymethylglutaryl-CoA reductase (NADPH)
MVTVPSFLLRRLYVRGSLRNTKEGVQFQLLNRLGAGYARKLFPLVVDGEDMPMERCAFSVDGASFSFDSVSGETPFTLDLNKTTTITLRDMTLTEKPHTIGMSFEVPGLGVLRFDFTDAPSQP